MRQISEAVAPAAPAVPMYAPCHEHQFVPGVDQQTGELKLICLDCYCEETTVGHVDSLGG